MSGGGHGRAAGLAAAVAAVGVPAAEPAPEAEVVPLPLDDDEHGLGTGHSPLAELADALNRPAGNRGRGRPKGSRNRTTEAFTRLFLSTNRSPLAVLAEIYQAPTAELARKLQADPIDVLRIQTQAAAAVAPYVHKRLPIEVANVGDVPLFEVNMGVFHQAAAGDDARLVDAVPIEAGSEGFRAFQADPPRAVGTAGVGTSPAGPLFASVSEDRPADGPSAGAGAPEAGAGAGEGDQAGDRAADADGEGGR